jgi:photosystem II stability/assembly factor-like uncharacterized protein
MRSLKPIITLAIVILVWGTIIWAGKHVWTTNGPKGGMIRSIVYDPHNRGIAYVSVIKGGIYRSKNGGISWQQIVSRETLGTDVKHIAINPINSNILYAVGYNGVFRSLDGGLTWQTLETADTNDIVCNPADTDTLFIATSEGILKSTDAGSTWTAVNGGLTHLNISSLALCPANPNVLYAGCWEAPVVFKTSNGGVSWGTVYSGSTGEQTRTAAVDPTNADIVYTSEYEQGGILKSTDGGAAWMKTVVLDYINMDANVIVVDPIASSIVYFGRNQNGLFKSVDSGSYWKHMTNGFNHGGRVETITVNSHDNDNILVGTLAGIFRSGDGAQSWNEENSGLNYTNIAVLAIDPANPDLIYAGTYGGGLSISTDGGNNWQAANNGIDGHFIDAIAVDPVSTDVVYLGGTFGNIHKSTDSGGSWTKIYNSYPGYNGAARSIVIDPGNTNIVYASKARAGQGGYTHSNPRGIFKSVDAGATWNEFNTGLTNLDVRTLIIDPSNTNILYAGTVGSGVFKTVNGAASWSASNSGLTNLDVRILALDVNNTDVIYAGTNGGGIFKSIDSGSTWTPVNNGLTNQYIRSLAVDRINGNKVFAGTEYANVYGSIDGGNSWVELNEGLPSYLDSIEAIAISPANSNLLYIGTYGGGVFQRTIDPDTIIPTPPQISLNRTQISFGAAAGTTVPPQTFLIENCGESTLNWTITANAAWLSCTPLSGTDSGTVTISVDSSGLASGTYNGTVTVSGSNAVNSPQTVSVPLKVYMSGASGVPFGEFATPEHGSTVRSSIPVTGWALDDIGIDSVKIYREPVAGEGSELVYIGDGLLVEGARPDVEQAYPHYPMNYKAGWGYMMLTNFLPNGGNGTFTLHAKAADREGNSVTLGVKTITCDNANAVKPFGAIDTPAQGGSASGSNFRNQGWVLTPLPDKVPEDGSTISVFVDGVYLGHPVYNVYRPDIAALFPGYRNSQGALAYFDFDTTAYENGVHTIQWTVTDDAGNTDGIGSRYFSIQNSGISGKMSVVRGQRLPEISEIPVDVSGAAGIIKKYNHGEPQKVYPNDNGIINIEIKELERLEIHINACAHLDSHLTLNTQHLAQKNTLSNHYQGYLMVGNQLKPLPIGSTLDTKRGIFYWQPGPGFIGEYRFMFVLKEANGKTNKQDMIVKIVPAAVRENRGGGTN